MKMTEDEKKALSEFLANPYFREMIENAPSEGCRNYIVYGLLYGTYCGYEPEKCAEHLENGLSLVDWKYILNNMGGNTRLEPKCMKRIAELERKGG